MTKTGFPRAGTLHPSGAGFSQQPVAGSDYHGKPTGTAAPVTPITIFGAALIDWWRADLGNTVAVDGNWVGQKAGLVLAQGTAANRATQSASGGPNSTAMMTYDGTNDSHSVSLVRPAPGTTPHTLIAIVRQESWTGNDPIFHDSASAFAIVQRTATPQLFMFNTSFVNSNNGLTIGSWGRLRAKFQNTGADSLKCKATNSTGAGAGNTAGTAFLVGVNAAGTLFGNASIAEIVLVTGVSTAQNDTDYDAYVDSHFGAGLT